LDQLVIGDEKQILYNTVQCKRIWKLADESAESMAKVNLHPKNDVFWNCKEIIYFELLAK